MKHVAALTRRNGWGATCRCGWFIMNSTIALKADMVLLSEQHASLGNASEALKPSRIIKVAVYVVVEVDVAELEAEYGRSYTVAEARQEVQDSIRGAGVQAAFPEHASTKIIKRVLA